VHMTGIDTCIYQLRVMASRMAEVITWQWDMWGNSVRYRMKQYMIMFRVYTV
jgi:hypothetical protein